MTLGGNQIAAYAALTSRVEQYRAQRTAEHDAALGRPLRPARARHVPYYDCGARLPSKVAGNGVSTGEAEFWLDLCARLCRDADDFDHETRRGWTIACRLLGLSWHHRERALSDVYNYSAAEAAPHWAHHLSAPDERYIGFVYSAYAVGAPDVVKIGFSRHPDRRMKQLSRLEGREVRLIDIWPGTMLHEFSLHQHGRRRVKAEWYPRETLPGWLLEGVSEAIAC